MSLNEAEFAVEFVAGNFEKIVNLALKTYGAVDEQVKLRLKGCYNQL